MPTLLPNIEKIICVSGYNDDYIAHKIGMSTQLFSNKRESSNWTEQEIFKIIDLFKHRKIEAIDDYMLGIAMQNTDCSDTLSLEEFRTAMGWK